MIHFLTLEAKRSVDSRGFFAIEPTAFRVLGECSNQLSYIDLHWSNSSRVRDCASFYLF